MSNNFRPIEIKQVYKDYFTNHRTHTTKVDWRHVDVA